MATFGKTTIGAKNYSSGTNRLDGSLYTLSEQADISMITLYVRGFQAGGTWGVQCAIYDALFNLRAVTEKRTDIPYSNYDWENFNIVDPVSGVPAVVRLEPGNYWLCWLSDGNIVSQYDDSGVSNTFFDAGGSYATGFPISIAGLYKNYGTGNFSVYATYVPVITNPLSVTLPDSVSGYVNEDIMVTASPSGGSGIYTSYKWHIGVTNWTTPVPYTVLNNPDAGSFYLTVEVTDSAGQTGPMSNPCTVTIYPVPLSWNLNVIINPTAGGIVTRTVSNPIPYGQGVTVQAIPNTGYDFSGWTNYPSNSTITTTTLPNDTLVIVGYTDGSTQSATANFVSITPDTYNLTIQTPIGSGIYQDALGNTIAPNTYAEPAGSQVQLAAVPSSNFVFDHWVTSDANNGSTNTTIYVGMTANQTVQAVFTQAVPPTGYFGKKELGGSIGGLGYGANYIVGTKYPLSEGANVTSIGLYLATFYSFTAPTHGRAAIYDAITLALIGVTDEVTWTTNPPYSSNPSPTIFVFSPIEYPNGLHLEAGEYYICFRFDGDSRPQIFYDSVTEPTNKSIGKADPVAYPNFQDPIVMWYDSYPAEISIYANYGQAIMPWDVVVTVETDGVVSTAGGNVSPGTQTGIAYNASVTETESFNSGYMFAGWTLDGVSKGAATSLVVGPFTDGATHTLLASFSTVPPPSVTIAPLGPLYVLTGGSQQFTASVMGGQGTVTVYWYDTTGGSYGTGTSKSISFPQAPDTIVYVYAIAIDQATPPRTSPQSNLVQVNVTAEQPNQLAATVTASPAQINPNGATTITVHVTANGAPVEGATVSLTTTGGILSPSGSPPYTGANGDFTSLFTDAVVEQVTITANVSMMGYTSPTTPPQGTVNVTTAIQQGFPIWAIPVGIGIVVLGGLLLGRKSK